MTSGQLPLPLRSNAVPGDEVSETALEIAAAPDAFRLVTTVEDRLPPGAVVEIPAHCLFEPGFEGLHGLPTELLLDLRSVNGITPIVARPVGYQSDQAVPRPIC